MKPDLQEWKSLIDPRFTMSPFYHEFNYRGYIATLDYHTVDEHGVFRGATSSVIIKDSELCDLPVDQIAEFVNQKITEANQSLVELIDTVNPTNSPSASDREMSQTGDD